MESLVKCNELWLQYHDDVPLLYDAPVHYSPEIGREEWQDIPHILGAGEGDCEDLACWRIAELRFKVGIKAQPFISWREIGGGLRYHALVRYPDGRIEDPSRALGMLGEEPRRPVFVNA